MKKQKHLIWGLLLALFLSILPIETTLVNAEERVIRVGYDQNSHFIQENNGEFFGYGVEYLNKISEYTNWTYEYVNVAGWSDSFVKLRTGEIDLICTAHYTEEHAAEFLYSDIPFGYETTLLYALPDSEITYQDYDAIDGCTVGLLKESYSSVEFIEYAEKHQIDCEVVYFEQKNDMRAALENGEIDLFSIGSRYGTSALSLVDRLSANAFYCITNKENPELIEEIEAVLQQIMFDDPSFEGNLNKEYFGHSSLSLTPLYTKEELAYIENLDSIKVKIVMYQHPSCYMENGKIQGIWAEYMNLLSEKSGISFELETDESDNYSEIIYDEIDENYLLLRTLRAIEHSDTDNILISQPLMDIDISYIKRQDAFVNENSTDYIVALTSEISYIEPMLLAENPSYQIVYYDNSEDCLDAVINKKADLAIQRSFRTSYLMQKPEYADKLTIVPGHEYSNQIHLVANEENTLLIEIINKAIHHISDEEKEQIVTKELLQHPYVIGFDDIWYQSWKWIIIIIAALIIGLCIYTIMMHRMAKLKIEKHENEMLRQRLQLDEITALYNRTYFFEIAQEMINNAKEEMCIVTMNINNFKIVNELYGMPAGDRLLFEIAAQLKILDEKYHIIPARFMSDHYYMCMPKRIFDEINFPRTYKTFLEDMDIRVVYGIYLADSQTTTPVNVMCDKALVAAHEKKQNYVDYIHFYNDAEHKQILAEQEIENNMERALAENQFYIVIQPKFNPNTRKIVGGETLVRWKHPEKGIISPGLFIPVFEKNGFIIHLDYFVWEETCRFLAKRKKDGKFYVPLSINVSRAHFYGHELKHKLISLVEKYDLETKDIELEITESLCGEDPDVIYDKIRELQDIGFKIAMDDFGSGYSSLNMLKEMPLDIIKMDLKFLDGEQEKGRLILKALIGMAQTMELKVVVEGVEISSQVEFLCQFKECSLQGYYFSRPIVTEEFENMLDQN